MTEPLRLCWWEVDELLEHMRSRPDLWLQSDTNPNCWLRINPVEGDGVIDANEAFALLFVTPKDATGRFRTSVLQPLPIGWDEAYVSTYLRWLLSHWTSYQQRTVVAKFLTDELKVPADTAQLAAIAIEGLSWEVASTPEPPLPPIQEELWPRSPAPPNISFEADPTLVGTFLLAGSDGWLQLRLLGGMLRASLSLRSKDGTCVLPLQGFVRPLNGRTRDAAAQIAGWPGEVAAATFEPEVDPIHLQGTLQEDLVRGPGKVAAASSTNDPTYDQMITDYDNLPEAN